MMAKQESHKFVYRPREHESDRIGYAPPVLDRHDRPLVYPELVHHDNPRAARVIVAGQVFETDDPHMVAFCKGHRSFRSHWGN
jgi:hypothetical protein